MNAQSKEPLREISPVALASKLELPPELSWKHLRSHAIRNMYILNFIKVKSQMSDNYVFPA